MISYAFSFRQPQRHDAFPSNSPQLTNTYIKDCSYVLNLSYLLRHVMLEDLIAKRWGEVRGGPFEPIAAEFCFG